MNYRDFNLGDWIGHISGVIEDETTLDGNEMRDLVEFLSTLKQELCKDCVSRKTIEKLKRYRFSYDSDTTIPKSDLFVKLTDLRDLPSVTSVRKKGKWQKIGCGITFIVSECTCCGKKTLFNCDELIYKYCPNCGAEMENE